MPRPELKEVGRTLRDIVEGILHSQRILSETGESSWNPISEGKDAKFWRLSFLFSMRITAAAPVGVGDCMNFFFYSRYARR
jgi:hypothetical protein